MCFFENWIYWMCYTAKQCTTKFEIYVVYFVNLLKLFNYLAVKILV